DELAAWNLSIQLEPPKSPTPIGFAVIHRGWLVHEAYAPDGRPRPTWIASIGKSITSCAVGNWIEAGRRDPGRPRLELESRVYDPRLLPEGFPLSDPRKAEITLFHLLSHTSGIQPEPDTRSGEGFAFLDYTVGHCAAFPESARLAFDPGTRYGYSSVGFNHFALMAPHVLGRPLHESVERELFAPIGVESLAWRLAGDPVSQNDRADGYMAAAGGPFLTARDLARYAYLHLHDGLWDNRRIVPRWYLRAARHVWRVNAAQPDDYALGLLTNHAGGLCADLPRDAYAFFGSGLNMALVIPSWDLIVVRTSRLWTTTLPNYLAELGPRLAALIR
ncbi:MAG TPA: serine hydrolase domain-containing protein, partial [Limnochordia bacterium]|nr:serine hydrolase domain-containing protein [Limnochordia bacterium]